MAGHLFVVIATTGPFGPTATMLVLLPLFLLGPFLLAAVMARSLLGADPIPTWLLVVTILGALAMGFLLWPARITSSWTGFWGAWRIAAVASVPLLPVVLFFEAGKRDWLRLPSRSAKRRRVKRDRPPPNSQGVFERDRP